MSLEQFMAIIGAGSTMGSAIFWSALLIGRMTNRVERVERRIEEIDHTLERSGQKMSDLANTVQTMPERFLTRTEALTWRGSRAEDRTS